MTDLRGERVYLRPLEEADVDDRYLSWFADRDLVKYVWGSPKDTTRADVLEELSDPTRFLYAICLCENDLCVGMERIGPLHPVHGTADQVTVLGDPSCRGKGLSVEAVELGIRAAFEVHGVRKLAGYMYAGNSAAVNTYLKAGWIIEARLKDHYVVNGELQDRLCFACWPSMVES